MNNATDKLLGLSVDGLVVVNCTSLPFDVIFNLKALAQSNASYYRNGFCRPSPSLQLVGFFLFVVVCFLVLFSCFKAARLRRNPIDRVTCTA